MDFKKRESVVAYRLFVNHKLSCLSFWGVVFFMVVANKLLSQCTNTTKNPTANVIATGFADTLVIAENNKPGDYFVVEDLIPGKSYTFLSSVPGDYFSIRDAYQLSTLIAHGAAPFTFTLPIGGTDIISVHLNLISPPCGTSTVVRKTKFVCNNCPAIPEGIGIGEIGPKATLEVKGEVKLGALTSPPKAGMMRWNDVTKDFEGYNGRSWQSFTQPNDNVGVQPSLDMVQNHTITAIDGSSGDELGYAVSVSGNFVLAGARSDDIGANVNQGSAYLYKQLNDSWVHQIKLTASDGKANDNFGNAVAISGDFAVVGAYLHDVGAKQDQGAAYVYRRQGTAWFFQAKLVANDGEAGDFFGNAVAIHHDYIAVGAYGDDVGANVNQGSVYVFKRSGSTWGQQTKLAAADGGASDNFGVSVAIFGNTIVSGCYRKDIGSNADQGAAYVYVGQSNVWIEQAKLWSNTGQTQDNFGFSVSLYQDKIAIGIPGSDYSTYVNPGAAQVYKRVGSTWSLEGNLYAATPQSQAQLGTNICLYDNHVLVSAYQEDYAAMGNQGRTYLFNFQYFRWQLKGAMRNNEGEANDWLGFGLGLSGEFAVCGASLDNIGSQTDQGSLSIFHRNANN
jgi:hypothetical protein